MRTDRPAFDLQSHSTPSDGALSAADVVARAADAGVELLALTDHDSVSGVPEAIAAAAEHGIRLSPAAELASVHGEHEDRHILGYELDPTDPGLQAAREAMADRLRELGFALDDAAFMGRESIGRPHLADAVLAHPDNAERLAREGIKGKKELFPPYLVPGAVAYVARSRPTVEEAIEVIHAAGGVAVWAHPFWDIEGPGEVERAIRRFAADGLDGVECFYPEHSREQTLLLHDACEARGLLSTGSSDFHGPDHEHFNRFRAFDLQGRAANLGPIGAPR